MGRLPKVVDEIRKIMGQLSREGKEFKILGKTFEELYEYQETEHDRQIQEERELKKQEKLKTIGQESIFGIKSVRSENRTKPKPQVKRLQHSSLKAAGKEFATPSKTASPRTPG